MFAFGAQRLGPDSGSGSIACSNNARDEHFMSSAINKAAERGRDVLGLSARKPLSGGLLGRHIPQPVKTSSMDSVVGDSHLSLLHVAVTPVLTIGWRATLLALCCSVWEVVLPGQ